MSDSQNQSIYSKQIAVPYYECNADNEMKLSGILRMMQQVSSEQLDVLGLPYEMLYREGMVFLLAKVGIEVERMPYANEKVIFSTEPKLPKGAQFIRDNTITTVDGEVLIRASTTWLLVNPESRRILRPASFPYELPVRRECEGLLANFKLNRPEGVAAAYSRVIRYSDIDCNNHVNNAVYGDIVCDFVPAEQMMNRRISSFVIQYENEAKIGDVLRIEVVPSGENSFYIKAQMEAHSCFEAKIALKAI